jgi:hypothetical protein
MFVRRPCRGSSRAAQFVPAWAPAPRYISVNPITGTNWEGAVQPDVPVPADQALERTLEAMRAKLEKRENRP